MSRAQGIKGCRGKAKNGALRVAQIDRCQIARKDVFGGVQGDQESIIKTRCQAQDEDDYHRQKISVP
jgi:hypothetical protein